MSSELQKQVSALKAKQVQVEPLQKGRKSLFLNPKEAAAIDVETVYDTAAQALGILSQYDNRFDDYKNTLLHPSSIQVRRELKTTEENNELNLQLSSLLKLLTLFIHNKYSHQIMEYLIRRYRVNEMNISDYILCVLPIHDSKLFARALQICTLDKNSIWSYLDGVKSSGSPLPRNALVRQCQVNSELIRVLAMSAVSSVNLALDRSNYNALSITFIETILAQFTSIVVDLVSAAANTYQTTLADNQLRAVCVFLFPALKCYVNRAAGSKVQLPAAAQLSLLRVWLRAGYTILLNITGRTKLSVLFLHVIAATLIGTVQSSLAQCISLHGAEALSEMIGDESSIHYEALHVLSRACTDEKFLLTEELLVILFDDDSITNSLFLMLDSLRQRLEKQVYVQPFCDCLARSLLEILIAHAKKISNSNTDHVSSLVISIPALCRTLCVKGFVSTTCVGAVIKTLLTQFTKCTFSVASESVIASNNKKKSAQSTVSSPSTVASSLLLLFSKYEPELFDSIVQELNQDLATDILHQQNLIKAPTSYLSLQDVLSVVFAKLPYHAPADDSLSLLLSLTSPSVVTRTAALLRFSTTVPTEPFTDTDDSGLQNDLEGIASAALQCLDEKENIELIKVAWSEAVFVRISAHLSPSLLLARCIDSVSFWLECQKLRPVESYVVLSIIFSSISHKRIMSNLVSTSVDGTNTQKGFDWLFVTLLTVLGDTSTSFHAAGNKDESSATAVAKATKGKGKIASKTQETSANSVIAAAIKCAQSFASVSPLLTAFDTARQASSTYNAVFASCITSSLLNTATSSEVLRLLYSIVQLSHNNIMKSGNNYSWVATTLHILVAIAKDLKTSTDEKGRVSLNLLLSIFVPLVVRVLMSKHVDATLHLATKSIRTLLEIIGNALVTYWDIVVETVLPVSSDETPLRLLSLLLATSQDGGKDLLPLCFQTFFPSSNIIQLLRIACTGDSTTHRIQPSDAKPFVPRSCSDHLLHCDGLKRLHVSSATRIGALKCVEAWLEAVSSHKDIFVLLSSQNLNPFSLSVATAIGACADSNVYIRECGLNICSRIAALPTLVVASKKANLLALKLPALLTAASSVTSAVSTLGDLVAISDVLSSRSSEIKMDATTTVEALRNGVVSDESKSNAQTRVLLLTIAAHFSTVNVIPILALPILRAASNCSLSISWEYVKCILNYYHDQCTIIGSIDNSSLITSTAASLNNISSTDSSLQSHICDFICSLISTGRSSLVLSSLESVLTTEWIASLSLDSTRERLFSHTFDICTQNRSDSTSDIIVRSSSIAQKLMERVKVSPKLIVESFQSKVALAMVSHAALLKKFPSTGTGATATLITQDIDDEDDVDNSNTENEFTSEMNKVNLVVNKILETVFASLKLAIGDSTTAKVENVTITYLCLCYKVGLELLNALNDDRLDAGFDYTRTLITDLLSFCLEASGFLLFDSMVAGDNLVSNTISSVAAKPSKKLSKSATLTAAQTTSNYGSNPTKISLEKDITILLRSLSLSNALQTQASCLQLLKHTVQANPIIGPLLIAQLGKFLATTAILEDTVGKDSLIRELLSTCLLTSTTTTQQLTKGISATEVRRVMPQSTVQSLLLHCAGMSTSTRERLLQICLEALGPCSLPACIATLLMQVMVSYEPEGLRSLQSADKDVTILLSISAQRKARRLLQTSLPEEMFRLAMQASLRLPFEIQIFTLITLLEQAHFLLEYISESSESTMIAKSTGASSNNLSGDEEGATTSYQMSSVKLSDGSYMLLDGMLLQEYVSTLTTISQVDSNVSAMQVDGVTDSLPVSTQRGQMATLTLLLLQFIAETIENKSFQFFVNTQMKNAVGDIQNHVVQTSFLQFSDKLLQVYALASNTLLKYTKENDELFAVNIGSELLEINKASVGKVVSSSCFEILRSLQALLDIPTFITIFQELLAHHDISVRQKAFDMLTSRLEALDMSTKASFVETELFIDLVHHLHANIRDLLLQPPSKSKNNRPSDGAATDQSLNANQRISLAQSAIICIDTLAKHFAKLALKFKSLPKETKEKWEKIFYGSLVEIISLSAKLSACMHKETATTTPSVTATTPLHGSILGIAGSMEIAKILGSNYLLCTSLCSVLGSAKCLPLLSVLMNELIGTYEKQRKSLKQYINLSTESNTPGTVKSKTSLRSKIFLLRSIITATSSVVRTMSAFAHSYLARILEVASPTYQFTSLPGISVLLSGVDNTVEEVISFIKPHLSVPVIVSVTASLTDCGHTTALAFARQLSILFRRLDRSEVVTHLGNLCAICVLYLDYRRVYGDGSEESAQVEAAAVEATVELSIKLTENELKSFLVRLEEWRDVKHMDDDEDEDGDNNEDENDTLNKAKSHSRGVCFYHFMSVLGSKLKAIFTPLMGPFWDHSAEELQSFASTVSSVYESISVAQPAVKKSKKNKSTDGSRSEAVIYSEVADNDVIKEFKAEIEYLLESVSLTCLHDSDGFIDDQIYEVMMPAVHPILLLRECHASDDEYLTFCDGVLTRTIVALVQASGKDILWKNFNHKILLACRDSRACVRLMAANLLHSLFTQVGEDYLGLLPESMPFIAELLEDDDEAVTTRAREMARLIEEMTGESISAYI